jgi:DNA-binding transcriptional MerR regulator
MPRWRSTRAAETEAPDRRGAHSGAPVSPGAHTGAGHVGRLTPYPGTGHSLGAVEPLSISQLAHKAGVHVETVRYYERRGLLRQPPRTPAGYRQYGAADLWRLQFIARAKHFGFTLAEVVRLTGEHDSSDSADAVLGAARAKLRALDERQKELDETRRRLARLIDICEDPTSEDCLALRVRG